MWICGKKQDPKPGALTAEEIKAVGCTLSVEFIGGAIFFGVAFIILYVYLLTYSILQSQSAGVAPISLVNGGPNGDDTGWYIYQSIQPLAPKDYNSKNATVKVKNNRNVTKQHIYGTFPTAYWDPIPGNYDPKDPTKNNVQKSPPRYNTAPQRFTAVRIEVSVKSFTPAPTGAVGSVNFRLIIPNHWYDSSKKTLKPWFNITCNLGSFQILSGKEVVPYIDTLQTNFQFPYGTVQLFPLDKYRGDTSIQCQYTEIANPSNSGYLNYILAVDGSDSGPFTLQTSFNQPGYQFIQSCTTESVTFNEFDDDNAYSPYIPHAYKNITFPTDDNIFHNQGSSVFTFCSKYVQIVPASFRFVLRRSPINIVFPIYLAFALWLMVITQTLAFLPFYFGVKKVDSYSIPLAVFSILFALPTVRSQMPGVPPLGAVIDFASFLWCIVVAVANLVILSTSWYFQGGFLDARVKAKKAVMEEIKKLSNKGLKKLTSTDVANLFSNTKREEFVPAVVNSKIDGKILAMIKNRADVKDLDLTSVTVKQINLLVDLEGWTSTGVPTDLLKDKTELVSAEKVVLMI